MFDTHAYIWSHWGSWIWYSDGIIYVRLCAPHVFHGTVSVRTLLHIWCAHDFPTYSFWAIACIFFCLIFTSTCFPLKWMDGWKIYRVMLEYHQFYFHHFISLVLSLTLSHVCKCVSKSVLFCIVTNHSFKCIVNSLSGIRVFCVSVCIKIPNPVGSLT